MAALAASALRDRVGGSAAASATGSGVADIRAAVSAQSGLGLGLGLVKTLQGRTHRAG